jgi:hypothetical protein
MPVFQAFFNSRHIGLMGIGAAKIYYTEAPFLENSFFLPSSLSAKAWRSFSPEHRKSRKSTPMHLQVWQRLIVVHFDRWNHWHSVLGEDFH